MSVFAIAANVPALCEVGDLVSQMYKLKTELCNYKTNFKLSLKPQSCQTPVLVAQHQIYQNYLHKNRTFRIFKSCKEEKNSRQKCSIKYT